MSTTVVTGATGQLGTAFRGRVSATFLDQSDVDFRDPHRLSAVLESHRPELIINCAAYTAVDRAEEHSDEAEQINGAAVGVLADYCGRQSAQLVTYSTDYVFSGESEEPWVESDPTQPVNAYGASKLQGEELALAVDALVVRTSWVVSGTHRNFIATMLDLAQDRTVHVVDDQFGCPTVVDDLADATLEAIAAGATGLLHLTNSGVTTWFELARAALELAGFDPERVQPTTTADYPTPAKRPAYSVLGSERRAMLGLSDLPHWRDSLPAVVDGLFANGVVGRR